VAEADNGRLRVLYYGRQDTSLASQVLLLPPGSYQFEAPLSGQLASGALEWNVRCLNGGGTLMDFHPSPGESGASFKVPASGCDAQWLELKGSQQDMPQDTDVQIGPARIERAGD
jgi:hypothetical protein